MCAYALIFILWSGLFSGQRVYIYFSFFFSLNFTYETTQKLRHSFGKLHKKSNDKLNIVISIIVYFLIGWHSLPMHNRYCFVLFCRCRNFTMSNPSYIVGFGRDNTKNRQFSEKTRSIYFLFFFFFFFG